MKQQHPNYKMVGCCLLVLAAILCQLTGYAENTALIPVGQTVGITLDMKGVTVVDTTYIETSDGKRLSPAQKAGLQAGDIIEKINETPVDSARELEQAITGIGEQPLTVLTRRNDKTKEYSVTPALSAADGKYRLGIWIKDAASGIGTITYVNPETREFGALGHGIAETPDAPVIAIKQGEILEANIVSVQKGSRGQPGELVGVFTEDVKKLGTVSSNTDVGLKGIMENLQSLNSLAEPLPIAERQDVHEGEAQIIANIDTGPPETFSVEIQKINKDTTNTKGMVIKVIDDRLLEKTGGIVQGMSGSPIIQNGKIIGAVTHVLVNDPTRGYGIFIENMLDEANKIK